MTRHALLWQLLEIFIACRNCCRSAGEVTASLAASSRSARKVSASAIGTASVSTTLSRCSRAVFHRPAWACIISVSTCTSSARARNEHPAPRRATKPMAYLNGLQSAVAPVPAAQPVGRPVTPAETRDLVGIFLRKLDRRIGNAKSAHYWLTRQQLAKASHKHESVAKRRSNPVPSDHA